MSEKKLSEVDSRKMRDLYEQGSDLRQIAHIYGINHTTVRARIIAAGGEMRTRGSIGTRSYIIIKHRKKGILSWLND